MSIAKTKGFYTAKNSARKDKVLDFLFDFNTKITMNPQDPENQRILQKFRQNPLKRIPPKLLSHEGLQSPNSLNDFKTSPSSRKVINTGSRVQEIVIPEITNEDSKWTQDTVQTEERMLMPDEEQLETIRENISTARVVTDRQIIHPLKEYMAKKQQKQYTTEELDEMMKVYKPLDPRFSDENCRKLQLKKKFFKNCVYYGQYNDKGRHGLGMILYFDGRVYEGDWFENAKNGKGIEIYANGNSYQGEFKNGRPHGYGTYRWNEGEIYKGEWKEGIKEGFGEWTGIKGDSYKGNWKNGKPNGQGVHVWINGDKYEGQFLNSLKNGQGTEWFSNGDFFKGSYVFGKPEGDGEYKWANGAHYVGQFKAGLRDGEGKYVNEKGEKYDGVFRNDLKEGYGTYIWPSGNKYIGNFKNDIREGYGEMWWVDGSIYKGNWKSGIQNGEGELIVPDQPTLKGIFRNNVFVEQESGDTATTMDTKQSSITPRKIKRGKTTEKNNDYDTFGTIQTDKVSQSSTTIQTHKSTIRSFSRDTKLTPIEDPLRGSFRKSTIKTLPDTPSKSGKNNMFKNRKIAMSVKDDEMLGEGRGSFLPKLKERGSVRNVDDKEVNLKKLNSIKSRDFEYTNFSRKRMTAVEGSGKVKKQPKMQFF